MRRTHSTDDSQAVSLFPFLAVLLSTMGSLLLVLVVMARQARLHAAQEREARDGAPTAADTDSLERSASPSPEELERLKTAASRLRAIREEGLREYEASRLRLRNGDLHLRQLQDELANLYREIHSLEEMGEARLDDLEQARSELARLEDLARQTEAKLEEEREAAADSPKSYAIIPYEGPNGTRRRPLYIECRRDNVILQPEGITLEVTDFMGPLGPGNPLASALRAAEDYYAASGQEGQPHGDPYPLILVRPDGIAAYYFVRKALEGWGTDFGYELLDDPWKLEFPLPNPALANAQQQAIELARARQEALAMAAPGRFGGGGGGAAGRGRFNANSFSSFAVSPLGLDDGAFESDGDGVGGTGREPYGARYASAPSRASGDSTAKMSANVMNGAPESGSDGHARGTNWDSERAGRAQTVDSPGAVTDNARQSDSGAAGAADSARRPVGPAASGSQTPGSNNAFGRPRHPTQGTAARVPGTNDPTASGINSVGSAGDVEPLAARRGANWALPQAGSGAVPVRRTIHVIVRRDRLAILTEQGATAGRAIPIETSIERAVDPLVEAVAEQIQSWGTAGRGLYWQPILVFTPGPDGMGHMSALRRLLAGSGLEVSP